MLQGMVIGGKFNFPQGMLTLKKLHWLKGMVIGQQIIFSPRHAYAHHAQCVGNGPGLVEELQECGCLQLDLLQWGEGLGPGATLCCFVDLPQLKMVGLIIDKALMNPLR